MFQLTIASPLTFATHAQPQVAVPPRLGAPMLGWLDAAATKAARTAIAQTMFDEAIRLIAISRIFCDARTARPVTAVFAVRSQRNKAVRGHAKATLCRNGRGVGRTALRNHNRAAVELKLRAGGRRFCNRTSKPRASSSHFAAAGDVRIFEDRDDSVAPAWNRFVRSSPLARPRDSTSRVRDVTLSRPQAKTMRLLRVDARRRSCPGEVLPPGFTRAMEP